tara:strand:+ start:13529 stop:14278 length:750 start_codon:yes stop_codon:yes gene_type:complete
MKQTILITGGTGKFGRAFIGHFINKGWQVIFTSTQQHRIDCLKRDVASKSLEGICADFTSQNSVNELLEKLGNLGYRVNHLVNNARSLQFLRTNNKGQTSRDDFIGEYLLDVVVPYELSVGLFNAQANDLKTITNIGSQYGLVASNPNLYEQGMVSPIQYGTAKAALQHLTKELAVRFAKQNVRVNCVAYGGVEGRVDDGFKKRYSKLTPTERMLRDSELAGPLENLINDSCSAITGHTLVADGGWSLW